jgi:penicillin-insensitive murein endopeptidase
MRSAAMLLFAALAGCGVGSAEATPGPARVPEARRASSAPEPALPPVLDAAAPAAASAPAAAPAAYGGEPEEIDDGAEEAPAEPAGAALAAHPLDAMSAEAIDAALARDPASLGSMSVGAPGAGALLNGVRIPDDPRWILQDPANAYGTRETVDAIVHCIGLVSQTFPDTPPLHVGHVSAPRGGHLRPHRSHQAGRDADLGYYYLDGARWYARAHAGNLDRARTWALVRAFVVETDVELILIDHGVQRLLEEHARAIGEDPAWLDSVFRGVPGSLPPLIRHARGHATHLHVRLFSPLARETARRLQERLVRRKLIDPPSAWQRHRVKKGETLGMLAKKYRTTVQALMRANGLRKTVIRAGHSYLVPRHEKPSAAIVRRPIAVPPRRLPPAPASAGTS